MKETNIVISFTEEDVKKHLDDLIEFWHETRKELPSARILEYNIDDDILVAECYIDAYQSIRNNLFGELKK